MKRDELDTILDEALATYSLQEPRAGLSIRVLARVRADGPVSRRGWWSLAAAVAALAVAAIAIHLRPVRVTPPAVVVHVAQVAVSNPPPQEAPRSPVHVRRVQSLPRREIFPSPAPLTPEESALLAFARQAPEAARKFAMPDKPLEIEAINIPPLQIDGLETGEMK